MRKPMKLIEQLQNDPNVNEHPCECCGRLWKVHEVEFPGDDREHWICESCQRKYEDDEDDK